MTANPYFLNFACDWALINNYAIQNHFHLIKNLCHEAAGVNYSCTILYSAIYGCKKAKNVESDLALDVGRQNDLTNNCKCKHFRTSSF